MLSNSSPLHPARWLGVPAWALLLVLLAALAFRAIRSGAIHRPHPQISDVAREVGREAVRRSLPERPFPDPLLRANPSNGRLSPALEAAPK